MSSGTALNADRTPRRYLANSSRLALAIGCAALAGMALSTPAAAIDWTGAVSTDWFMATNWSTGVVPTAGSAVVVDTTAPNATLISGGPALANGMSVGLTGTGALTIANGGSLMSNLAYVGNMAGSTGTATVTGAGSLWNAQLLVVGSHGTGTLAILNGGAVDTTDWEVAIADHSGSSGSVTVDGKGSTLTGSDIVVGNGGTGTLIVSNGGTAVATKWTSIIAQSASSVGTATVTGAGSLWSNASNLFVAQNGAGSLTVSNGGAVSVAGNTVLGYQPGSVGTATVTGANSTWTSSSDMDVGRAGSGALTIANGGVVSVAGAVTLATMAGSVGTLNIGSAAGSAAVAPGTLSAATVAFGLGDGTINFNHTGTGYAFGTAISGAGTINQIAGATILTADSSAFTGATNVSGGRFAVNGSLANSIVTVSGGILGGTGTVGGIVANSGGIVGPGNSIGTLNVNGNVSFAAGSTYQVEANAAGQSDRIAATGSATLNGGAVSVLIAPGAAKIGNTYTILTAAGGITGSFAGAAAPTAPPFLAFGLTYDATTVTLGIRRSAVTFASAGLTANQIATGGGADSIPVSSSLASALVQLDLAQARGAFDQLSGELHASAKGVMIEDSRFVREAAVDRLRAAFDSVGASGAPVTTYVNGRPVLAPASAGGIAVWGRGFGSWGQWNGDGNAATLKRDIGGFLAGADAPFVDGWRIGAVGGYSRSNFRVNDRTSSGASDNYHVGLYGGTQWGDLAFRSGLAFTRHDISTGRSVAFPGFAGTLAADYSAVTTQGFGELGYRIRAGQTPLGTLAFEPFANLAYVSLSSDGFTERGGAAALTSRGDTTGVTFTTLGLRASSGLVVGNGVTATTRGMLGWRHGFGDTTPVAAMAFAGASAFGIAGVPIARDGAVTDLGFDVNLTPNAALGLSYGGQFGSGVTDHTLRGNFAVRF